MPMNISTQELLNQTQDAVQLAGQALVSEFKGSHELSTWDEVVAAIAAADERALSVLRPLLKKARPEAGWVEDELEDGPLPSGEWWVVDPVEGAINYVHGIDEWAVTATLVRDNQPS